MKYTFTEITDKQIWEDFFYAYAPQALFQSWLWGEVTKKEHIPITRFGMYSNSSELIAVFQVMLVRAKRGHYVHVRHGPLCKVNNKEQWEAITSFLKDFTKKQHALFFRISPLVDLNSTEMFKALGYKSAEIHAMDAEYCWVLPLDESQENLLKAMRKTTRYEIKRGEKMGIEILKSTHREDYHYFEQLYKETAKRQGFVPHKGIQEEFELFSQEDQAMLFIGRYQGETVAAAIILFTGMQGIYHHGASVSNKIPASYLIQWEAIKEAKSRGMKLYNFWGIAPSGIENHPWNGLTLFKKGFGGHDVQYLHAQDFPVSPFYILPKSVEKIRRMRKGY